MDRREFFACMASSTLPAGGLQAFDRSSKKPNIVLIYADDLGYGDISCYGAKRVSTPHIDRLATEGLRFLNAHAPSATCTPSRYAMLTGEYAWRRKGTGVLPGDARMIIEPGRTTLPSVLKKAGYRCGVVGKWHLGLGEGNVDWNREIKPGPSEIGFDYHFLIPATGDRVPCVFVEDHHVVDADAADPIRVSYSDPVGQEPTGRDHPELLQMHPSHGHDQTIVNGISRIGYMSGGKKARWKDEEIADVITGKAIRFLQDNRERPFFLYFATHDIHVPRVPHPRFAGRSGMGPRGDAILQLDESVGQILETIDRLQLRENTLVLFTSDNGPVVDDGYKDQAVEKLSGHRPAGPLRGGKYSAFDAGTRIPFLVRWPGQVRKGDSPALMGQIDLLSSFSALVGQNLAEQDAPDSLNHLAALLGRSKTGRDHLVEHSGTLALLQGKWKYIEPGKGARYNRYTDIELGNDTEPQLYDLSKDLGERNNLAGRHPQQTARMAAMLQSLRQRGRTRR